MAETRVLNGSEIVIECLKEQGVKTVFGYPGGAILNIYDALYKHQDEIHHILTSHEQLPDRVQQTWLPVLQLHTWILSRLLRSPVTLV